MGQLDRYKKQQKVSSCPAAHAGCKHTPRRRGGQHMTCFHEAALNQDGHSCGSVPIFVWLKIGNGKYPAMNLQDPAPTRYVESTTHSPVPRSPTARYSNCPVKWIRTTDTCVQRWCSIHLCHGCARHAALADHASVRIVSFSVVPSTVAHWPLESTRSLSRLPDMALLAV